MLVERGMNYRVSWMRLSSTELYGTELRVNATANTKMESGL